MHRETWLVMKLYQGDLRRLFECRQINFGELSSIMKQVLEGMEHMHSKKICHRCVVLKLSHFEYFKTLFVHIKGHQTWQHPDQVQAPPNG